MITVTLTPNEVHLAASHGLLRRYEKLQGKRSDRIQKERSNWDNEIEGACAELAWAKHLGVYWSGVSDLKAKDGADMEVLLTFVSICYFVLQRPLYLLIDPQYP